jgi:hypothetical protein
MPSPVYAAGTPGNLISGVSVAAGGTKTVAAFLDISTCVEGQVTCEMTTGTTAPPTLGTTFSAYKAYAAGASAPITLTASAAASSTSLSVSNTTDLHAGQQVALVSASTKVGELVTISAISGTTLTVGATTYGYNSGDLLYLAAQTASFAVQPTNPSTGTWAPSKDYSSVLFLGPSQWIIAANNTDTAQPVTVNVTYDRITAIQ